MSEANNASCCTRLVRLISRARPAKLIVAPGGISGLKQSELEEVELDVSSLGPLSTAMAALFSKMGVPIKTSVPLAVMDAARLGSFRAELLPFGAAVAGRVDKNACHFYQVPQIAPAVLQRAGHKWFEG